MPEKSKIPPIIFLLAGLLIFMVITVVLVSKWSPDDGSMFQLLASVVMTILGILANQIQPDQKTKTTPPPGSTTHVEQVIQTPPIPPETK